jgi:hypothetical protein
LHPAAGLRGLDVCAEISNTITRMPSNSSTFLLYRRLGRLGPISWPPFPASIPPSQTAPPAAPTIFQIAKTRPTRLVRRILVGIAPRYRRAQRTRHGLRPLGTGAPPPGVIECCMGGLHRPVLAGLLYPADEPGLGAFL